MTRRLALLLVPLLVVPFVWAGADDVPAWLDLSERDHDAAPHVRLHAPHDGDGLSKVVRLAGEARREGGLVRDVQWRLDGGPWQSLREAPRGVAVSVFETTISVPAGTHLLEVRAYDGTSYGPARGVRFAAADPPAPTVRVLSPLDGEGVAPGPVTLRGTVEARGDVRVLVSVDDAPPQEARVVSAHGGAALWDVTTTLAPGDHRFVVRAVAQSAASVPLRLDVRAHAPAPPTIHLVAPEDGLAVGTRGGDGCARCVRVAGTATGAAVADVRLRLDDGPARSVRESGHFEPLLEGAAWSLDVPLDGLFAGHHRIAAAAVTPEGVESLPAVRAFHLRSPRALAIVGDDAPRATHTPLSFRLEAPSGSPVDQAVWRLDGAEVATGPNLTFALATPGAHELHAALPQPDGTRATARLALWASNRAPVVALEAEPAPARSPTRLVASATDADGRVDAYLWNLSDGTSARTTAPELHHAFLRQGLYRVNVTAVDDQGDASPVASVLVPVPNARPTIAYAWAPRAPSTLDEVVFEDRSLDPEGTDLRATWIFPGDVVAHGPRATHRFAARGPQPVTLTVTDADGGVATRTFHVDVRNVPPVARLTVWPEAPRTGEEVVLRDESHDPDGRIVARAWHLSGHADERRVVEGATVHTRYDRPGLYSVMLVVEDDGGVTSSSSLLVRVGDAPPRVEAVHVEPEAPAAKQTVRFRAAVVDPEDGNLSFTWSFGDGTTAPGPEAAHRYARSGLYEASLRVVDAAGQTVDQAFHVHVRNALPEVVLRLPAGARAGVPFTVHAEAHDPDGKLTRYAFDLDDDGTYECDGATPRCEAVREEAQALDVRVRVEDDEGGWAQDAGRLQIAAPPPGWAPPEVVVERPAAHETLRGAVLLAGRAGGSEPIARVEAQLQNDTWRFAPGNATWAIAEGRDAWRLLLDSRLVPDGRYALVVRAVDTLGGVGEARVPVHVLNAGASEIRLSVANLEPDQPVRPGFTVRGGAHHPDGVTAVRWRIDEGPWQTAQGDPRAWGVRLPPLAPGQHVLEVAAFQGLHERGTRALAFVVPDETPRLHVDLPPPEVAHGRLLLAGHVAGPADARLLWRLDALPWREAPVDGDGRWRLDLDTSAWRNGHHAITVKAQRADATAASGELRFPFRVANVDPEAERLHAPVEREVPGPGVLLPILAALAVGMFGDLSRKLSTRRPLRRAWRPR